MVRLLPRLFSFFLLMVPLQVMAQRRTIMEGLAAGATAIYVSTSGTVGVGLSTTTILSKLHVHNGDVRISTSAGAVARGIIFQDNTTQTTAVSAAQLTNAETASLDVSDAYIAIATLTITAGVWLISGEGYLNTGNTAGVAISRAIFCISTSNTSCDTFAEQNTVVEDAQGAGQLFLVSTTVVRHVGPRRVDLASSTTYYLVCRLTYTNAGTALCGVSNRIMQAIRIK